MEHKEIKLEKKRIYNTQTNVRYVEMLVPEGWSISIIDDKENYGGYNYPYTFRIKLTSPDKTAELIYFSPRNYLDDDLRDFRNGQIDDYGNLLRHFETIETYLGDWANNSFKNFPDARQIDKIIYSNTEKYRNERKEKAVQRATDKRQTLLDYYYDRITNVYSYRYKETDRIRLYSGLIEGEEREAHSSIPVPDNVLDRNFTIQTMMAAFPDATFDAKHNMFIRRTMHETYWNARCLFYFDCMAIDYEYTYKNIFSPILNQGVTICDDIWNDFDRIKKEKSVQYQKIREEKKEAARIQKEAAEARRKASKETLDYVRKTQQETHDIIRSSYENTRRSQAKLREMWGDVNQGNTRFVDRYGNEHVVHTYNDYAYKKGDTYVTSNSPLDNPYDWEELQKKKY
ncbi:MAG: hypothetical protein J6S49_03055 [Erysipelotrichaceae bacterium]|nr:hypothetical protein [Erysipelotrichaceae bacterium]